MQSNLAVCLLLALEAPALAAAQAAQPPPSSPSGPSSDTSEKARLEAEISREVGATRPAAPAQPGSVSTSPGGATPPPSGAQGTGGNPLARLLLLPDISAIASFAGVYDSEDVDKRSPDRGDVVGKKGQPTFLFQELELGLQGVVDPYFRADAFVSFSPGGVDVEEAYATTLSLPAGLQLRAGKFFSPFGRMNQQHPHTWEFVDAPLARGRLLAADVLSGPGAVASWLAPLPWYAQLELAGQTTAPFDGLSPELTGLARLLQYYSFTEATSLGVGLSAARRREGAPGAFRDLYGADAYFRYRPVAGRAYLAAQGELYVRKFRNAAAPDGTPLSGRPEHGWWAQAFWRQDAFIGYGLRYEEAPAAGLSAPGTERRTSAVLDWYPSEFSRVALEPSCDLLPGGRSGFEGIIHFEFILGAHGAHPF
ncbi:MAG TPA: hypothetical protein VFG59_06790 [Anaeromyxobacter sp.]|nr:hypothetical protein [Anaeromyxobacter sp.]